MAKPLMPLDVIYDRALALLDAEGSAAFTTRRLTADLGISSSTLYQQVGSREQLVRALVARHFSQLRLAFHDGTDWESTALHWCEALRDALYAHPFLTQLMTVDDRDAVMAYVNELLDVTLAEGIPSDLAIECCRALVNFTINHSVMEVRGWTEPKLAHDSSEESRLVESNFSMAIGWILVGVRQQAHATSTKSRRNGSRRRTSTQPTATRS